MERCDYPWLYRASDSASGSAQQAHLRALKAQLALFFTVGIFSAVPTWVDLTSSGTRKFAVASALFLAAGLLLAAIARERKYEEQWFEFRAVAESAKTLTWRLMMNMPPFESEKEQVEQKFIDELEAVSAAQSGPTSKLGGLETDKTQISEVMRTVRKSSFEERKAYYLGFRVVDQRDWYHTKAAFNRRRASQWFWAVVGIQFVALTGSVLRAADIVTIAPTGVLMTLAAAFSAWTQAKRHQELATSYSVAANELTNLEQRVELCTSEIELAPYIEDVEEAISREHTMWRARRNVAP